MTMFTTKSWTLSLVILLVLLPVGMNAQPRPRVPGITVKRLGFVGSASVRIRRDPASGVFYVVQNDGVIKRVRFGPGDTATFIPAYSKADHGLNAPLGIAFDQQGTMYLVGNDSTGEIGTAMIVRGVPNGPGDSTRTWSVIARTVPFRYGNVYNHRMNGIVVSTGQDSLYINNGAATDHGEVHNGFRETGLTSIILKLPVHPDTTIVLQDDREWLRTNGYLFAEGIRNTFDLAYAGNGDLFGVENSGDRDDPEELNWLREGRHYGFPWRIGTDNTPQQHTPYDPHTDPLLSPMAWGGGNLYVTFSNDPSYPPPPAGIEFTDPIPSNGPDADRYRDTLTGTVMDASASGTWISTFTPHRSPDGIVFDRDSLLTGDYTGDAFVISLARGSTQTVMGDTGGDLVHVKLEQTLGEYRAHVTRLVGGFNSPLGIELLDSALYVLETGLWTPSNPSPALWKVTLPRGTVTSVATANAPSSFSLEQNWPNPFNPSTTIAYQVGAGSRQYAEGSRQKEGAGVQVKLAVYDLLGREVAVLVNGYQTPGEHRVVFNASTLASGVYMYRLLAGGQAMSRKLVLLK